MAVIVLANALGVGVSRPVRAAGFRLPDASIAGLATGNAVVANPEEIGAMPYNPAAMAFHKGTTLSGGGLLFWSNMDTTNAGGKSSIDVPRPTVVPAGYVSMEIADAWRGGLGLNAPFGLQTNWPAGSFPAFAASGLGALEPARSKIEMFNVNPNVSYRVTGSNDRLQLSVAGGVNHYVVRKAQLDTHGIGLSGKGNGWGWNIAALGRVAAWSFGISHRSSVGVDIKGDVTAGPASGSANTEVRFPSITQAGVRFKMNDLAVEVDAEYTRWSVFDRLVVTHSNAAVPPGRIVSTNDWNNSWTYRLGTTYDLSGATRLRAGYASDKSPLNDTRFSARLPDADRNIFMLGLSQKIRGWIADLGYSYTKFDSRTYTSTVPFGTYGADPNGTNLFNGSYQANVHVLGLGMTKQF